MVLQDIFSVRLWVLPTDILVIPVNF